MGSVKRITGKRGSVVARVFVAAAAVAGVALLVRSIPDLVRYLRVQRM